MGVCFSRSGILATCRVFSAEGIIKAVAILKVIIVNDQCYTLATELGRVLGEKGLTISTAESCTGGGIAYAITSTAGSSDYFNQSYVTYSNQAKQQLLDVKAETLENYGAVSAQTVQEMAKGCLRKAAADIAIAVSGIAGPGGGSADKPVGTVWFGFAMAGDLTFTVLKQFDGDRMGIRNQAIAFALTHAQNCLKGIKAAGAAVK